MSDGQRIAVVGAGPAGLGAALELTRAGIAPLVIDRNDQVGGLARTIWYKGYGFDLGPHRFFTQNREIEGLWKEMLGADLREVSRLTRIYYKGRFFHYPLRPWEAFMGLGSATSLRAVMSYALERLRNHRQEPQTFEDWVVQNFGRVLFSIFFKTYTEKVWGIPCDQIGREWAGQRIRGLNLAEAMRSALGFKRQGRAAVRSLVERFYYPRLGAGQMWDTVAARIRAAGGEIRLRTPLVRILTDGERISTLVCGQDGEQRWPVSFVFASAPITAIVRSLVPPPPPAVLAAARALYYRAHITVNLIVQGDALFPDNWIYVHAPHLRMARVANYNNFSMDMLGRHGTSALSVEYFCFEGDELWRMPDETLLALAGEELEHAGLVSRAAVLDGFVVREQDSYPAYYLGHQQQFQILYQYLRRFSNLCLIGRAGMYRYNNQDHSTLTGIYAVRNFLNLSRVDLFSINAEDAYIEEVPEA